MFSVRFNYVEVTSGCRLTCSRKQTDSCPFFWYDLMSLPCPLSVGFHHQDAPHTPPHPIRDVGWTHLHPGPFGMKEPGAQRAGREPGGIGGGEASKHLPLLFSASVEPVARIREAGMSLASSLFPDVDSRNPVMVRRLPVFKKKRKKTSDECSVNLPSCTLRG